MKRALIVLFIIAVIGAGAGAYYIRRGGVEPQVNTSPVTRGDIIDTVGASGTLQAVTTVLVGSQVSGNISWLGADFNSIVRKGQVIARLDPSLLDAQVQQARANLTRARADSERNKVALDDAQTKYSRAKDLASRTPALISQSDLDAARVAVDVAKAQIQSSEAQIAQAQASLGQNEVNLQHTVITAPIDGIVTSRNVDVGQTVAASMSAPTLFVIAADLTKMQVNASIDESDVGRIRPGQHVTFRVDAYPTEQFDGTVVQVRLQPVVVQNVTTYGTVIDVPNQELKLKPGMTANVKVEIAKRSDVLRVPNASLRFRPTPEVFAALNQTMPSDAQFAGGGRGAGGQGGRGQGGSGRGGGGGGNAPAAGQPAAGGSAVQSAPALSAEQHPPASSAGAPAMPSATSGRSGSEGGRGTGGNGGGRSMGGEQAGSGGRGGFGRDQAGGGRGFGRGPGNADDPERRARMMERFKAMPPDEQKQFVDRLKSRGQDVSAFEQAASKTGKPAATRPSAIMRPKYGAPQSAETIDALFAPLPTIETRGRAWLYMNKELKPVSMRLGISDGTNTELLSSELQPGMELVTGVLLGSARPTPTSGGTGNPLMPRGGPGGFGGDRGGPGGGGRGR